MVSVRYSYLVSDCQRAPYVALGVGDGGVVR